MLFDIIPVFPSDSKGLGEAALLLEREGLSPEEIEFSFPKWHQLQKERRTEPDTNYRRWKRISAQEEYLKNHPKLFQWLCTLAVYPNPNWDMTIAIGEALSNHGVEVSYDNLLILARIPWLQSGVLHPKLRQELLNQISPDIELAAREAVRRELAAVQSLTQNSHVSLELETNLAIQNFAMYPEDKEYQNTINALIEQGIFNNKQVKELDQAVERYQSRSTRYQGQASIQSFLKEANKGQKAKTETNKATNWRIAIASLIVFVLSLFLWQIDEKDALYQFAFGASPQPFIENPDRKLQDYFYIKEKVQLDSATIYNNQGVDRFANRRSVSLAIPDSVSTLTKLKVGGQTAITNFQKALNLRTNYTLAQTNLDKSYLNIGTEIYNGYLNDSLSLNDLRDALPYFATSAISNSVRLDALHGLGLSHFYLNQLDSAFLYHDLLLQETDSLYFDTLSLALNLQDLLPPQFLRTGSCAQLVNVPYSIAVRTRILSAQELNILNRNLPEKKSIDRKTYAGNLSPGDQLIFLKEEGAFFKIRFNKNGKPTDGYIANKLSGKATLEPCTTRVENTIPEQQQQQQAIRENNQETNQQRIPPNDFSYSSIRLGSQSYRTLEINGRIWMADNLNYEVEGSTCYNNNSKICQEYGRLYTWDAAQKACAALGNGWRLPTDEEWNALRNSFGGEQKAYTPLIKGGASGFEGQLGGTSGTKGNFSGLNRAGQYWTSSGFSRNSAWYYWFGENTKLLNRNYGEISDGRSCRCIYDPTDIQIQQQPPVRNENPQEQGKLPNFPQDYGSVNAGKQAYRTLQLVGLTWLADNLNINIDNSYCFDDNSNNCVQYGRLYTWEAAKEACRSLGVGWRLPTIQEWDRLVGNFRNAYPSFVNDNGGFNAMLGGYRWEGGNYVFLNEYGYYWSSSLTSKGDPWYYWFDGKNQKVAKYTSQDLSPGAQSCRCVKD